MIGKIVTLKKDIEEAFKEVVPLQKYILIDVLIENGNTKYLLKIPENQAVIMVNPNEIYSIEDKINPPFIMQALKIAKAINEILPSAIFEIENKIFAKEKEDWYNENFKLGIELGYPSCCIDEFCMQTPSMMETTPPSKDDYDRYQASILNEKYTGFIPCTKHAKQIINGEIKLHDLITNRSKDFPPFPNY